MPFKPSRLALVLLAAALAGVAAAPVRAQQGPKIAVIDTQMILTESETGKKALAELRTLQEQKEKEGDDLQQQLKGLQTRITEGRLSLAEDKLADLQQQLEDKQIELKRFGDDAQRVLNKKRDEVLAAIDKKVMPVIAQLGQEQGYTLIFRKFESGLIFAADEVDITDEVIKRVDGGNPTPAASPGSGG